MRFLAGRLQANPAEMPRLHLAHISFFCCNTKPILLLHQKTRRITSSFLHHENCRLQSSRDTLQGLGKQGTSVQSSELTAQPWALSCSDQEELT